MGAFPGSALAQEGHGSSFFHNHGCVNFQAAQRSRPEGIQKHHHVVYGEDGTVSVYNLEFRCGEILRSSADAAGRPVVKRSHREKPFS